MATKRKAPKPSVKKLIRAEGRQAKLANTMFGESKRSKAEVVRRSKDSAAHDLGYFQGLTAPDKSTVRRATRSARLMNNVLKKTDDGPTKAKASIGKRKRVASGLKSPKR